MNRIVKTAAALTGAAAIMTAGAAYSNAEVVPSYSKVDQMFCSPTGATVSLSYQNEYGNDVQRSRTYLDGQSVRGVTCITRTIFTGSTSESVGIGINGVNGDAVYCALFVNGYKVAESSDDDPNYSIAMCY